MEMSTEKNVELQVTAGFEPSPIQEEAKVDDPEPVVLPQMDSGRQ